MLAAFFVFTTSYQGWFVPTDAWTAWQGAQFVDHGWYGAMYRVMPSIPLFPVWPVVLAPFRALGGFLGLQGGFAWEGVEITPARASAWLLYGPVCAIGASVLLFAGDALAVVLGATRGRRLLLTAALTALSFYVAIDWGHPEDMVATGLVLYALLDLNHDRPGRAGWLAGAALACQPLVILAVPVLLARLSKTTWARFALRMAVVPVALLLPPFLTDFSATWKALGVQQTDLLDHPTAFVSLGHHLGNVVYAGPFRSIVVVLVAAIAFFLARRHDDLAWAVVVAGLALLARQLGEEVMNPYYLAPGFAVLVVVLVVKRPAPRALAGIGAAVLAIVLANLTVSPWAYSLLVAAASAACVLAAWPLAGDAIGVERQSRPARPAGPAAVAAGTQPAARLVTACVVAAIALAGLTVYGRSSSAAQYKVMTVNWKALAALGNLSYGLPVPDNLSDRVFHLQGTKVTSDPTLNPDPLWSVPASADRLARTAASAAETVAEEWRRQAWIDPSKATLNSGSGSAHALASRWIADLGAPDPSERSTLVRGPEYCTYNTGSQQKITETQLGAPDYRLMLWYGCGKKATWLDGHAGVQLRPVRTSVVVGPPFDRIYLVTNPSSTKVLAVYIGWSVHAALHVAPMGQRAWTYKMTLTGEMELRPGPSGYRIWNPWLRYGFSGHNVFTG
jgi:hypothetical protein